MTDEFVYPLGMVDVTFEVVETDEEQIDRLERERDEARHFAERMRDRIDWQHCSPYEGDQSYQAWRLPWENNE